MIHQSSSVQTLRHIQLCDPMDCITPGFPVHHQFLKLVQTQVHQIGDTIQSCHSFDHFSFCLQSFPASGSFQMSQFFISGGQIIGVSASASVLLNECSGLISFRIDWFDLLAVQGILKSLHQHHNSKASVPQDSLWSIITSIHGYWKTHSFD